PLTPALSLHDALPIWPTVSSLLATYDALLDEFMPPSLLVNDQAELVHAFGGASKFLRVKDGRQGLDAFEMVDAELKMVLMGGLQDRKSTRLNSSHSQI